MESLLIFNRIMSGKPYGKSLKLYSKKYMMNVVKLLEEDEEYEKCKVLLEYINNRFDHELNYKTPIF
jgi:hypothetical protein